MGQLEKLPKRSSVPPLQEGEVFLGKEGKDFSVSTFFAAIEQNEKDLNQSLRKAFLSWFASIEEGERKYVLQQYALYRNLDPKTLSPAKLAENEKLEDLYSKAMAIITLQKDMQTDLRLYKMVTEAKSSAVETAYKDIKKGSGTMQDLQLLQKTLDVSGYIAGDLAGVLMVAQRKGEMTKGKRLKYVSLLNKIAQNAAPRKRAKELLIDP